MNNLKEKMKYKEDNPDNLGGLGDVLPAEVLKMLNGLLERLHQAGHIMTFIVGENGTLSDISAHDCKIECYRPQQVGYEQENHHRRTARPCVILLK